MYDVLEVYEGFGQLNVITYIYIVLLGLLALGGFFRIRTNDYKRYMKEENGRTQLAEIKRWDAIYFCQPTIYEITVEYVEDGEKKERLLKSSASFPQKYKKKKVIEIVTVPGTDFLFAKEENWREQNINGCMMIGIALVFEIMIIQFAEGFPIITAYFILFLYFALLFFGVWLGKKQQTRNWHKTRMKYVTKLSCEEVLERLRQGTDSRILLEKEKDDRMDVLYLLSMNSRAPFYSGGTCEKARYRVLVTLAQEGSAVWVYLSECSNPYALNRYAERLKKFLEKRIEAVRIE